MRIFLTIFLITLFFASCEKGESVVTPDEGSNEYGHLFFVADSSKTLNASSGQVIMSKSTNNVFAGSAINPIAFADSVVYARNKQCLLAFNIFTGQTKFEKFYNLFYMSTASHNSYPLVVDTIVYVAGYDEGSEKCSLYAYNKNSGNKLFGVNISYNSPNRFRINSAPLVSGNDIYVSVSQNHPDYSGSSDVGSIYCFNRLTGTFKWNKILNGGAGTQVNPFLRVVNGNLLVTGKSGSVSTLYALNTATGDISWSRNLNINEYLSEKSYDNGKLYSVSTGTSANSLKVSTINATDGAVMASSQNFENVLWETYFLSESGLYFVDADFKLKHYSFASSSITFTTDVNGKTEMTNGGLNGTAKLIVSRPLVTDKYIYLVEKIMDINPPFQIREYNVVIYNKNTGLVKKKTKIQSESFMYTFIFTGINFNVIDKNGKHYSTNRGL